MRLTLEQKKVYFDEILQLNNSAFTGVERAPLGIFKSEFYAPDTDVFASFEYGRVIAFAIVFPRNGSKFIWAIAVDERFRGEGIGSALLQEIAGSWNGVQLSLTCNVNNWRAQRLYLALGYRVTKVLRDYYRPDDGIEMRRKP